MMIFGHIIMNLLFFLFVFLNANILLNREKMIIFENKVKYILSISFVLGLVTYLTYIVMMVKFIAIDGFDKQSFSLLILSWAFMFATKQIASKQLLISKK